MDWNEQHDARLAVLAELTARAPAALGRTALMKFRYFLQELRKVPPGYRFSLYIYGPFDSRVLSDLSTAESLSSVASKIVHYPGGYGYEITAGERSDAVREGGKSFLDQHRESIDWVLNEFGSHGSAELELESTIGFVDREAAEKKERLTITALAGQVRDVKPHLREDYILEKTRQLAAKGLLTTSNLALAGD
jgi:hypothetical protein